MPHGESAFASSYLYSQLMCEVQTIQSGCCLAKETTLLAQCTIETVPSNRQTELHESWPKLSREGQPVSAESRRSSKLATASLLIIVALCLTGLAYLMLPSHGPVTPLNPQGPRELYHPTIPINPVQKHVNSNSSDIVAIDQAFLSELDGRGNVGSNVTVYFHSMWASNGSDVDSGFLYVNTTPYGINETGWVSFVWNSPTVDCIVWNVTGVDAGGIIAFDQRVPPPSMIWDALRVVVWNDSSHINVGSSASLGVTGEYLYDGMPYDGVFTLNDTVIQQDYVGRRGYNCASATGDTYDITTIAINHQTHVTWDSITVTITVADEVINIGENALISVMAVFDYDGSPYSGIFTLNDSILVYYTPGRRAYTVSEVTPLASDVSVISTNDVAYVTWDAVYVDEVGVWGRSPFFDPEVEFHASGVIQSELDLTLTIYFYLRYMSDDSLVTDPDTVVVVNGRYATYVSGRERWEVNVTSEGIGPVTYQIEYYRDSFGLAIEDPLELYISINWFPSEFVRTLLLIGTIGLVLFGGAFMVLRTRRRLAQLERALGPDGVLSVEEVELPARTREEIIESMNWLEEVYPQIPTMDKKSLVSLEKEMRNSMSLLEKAINRDSILTSPDESLSKLKWALLIRARLVLETVAKEIASRS